MYIELIISKPTTPLACVWKRLIEKTQRNATLHYIHSTQTKIKSEKSSREGKNMNVLLQERSLY